MPRVLTILLTITLLGLPLVASAERDLLPSEFTILANHALLADPGVDRKSVTTPLMERLHTDDLSEMERFMKGEVHFLHLQPEDSRDEYWAFRDRDDDLGRVAFQRLMIIRINGFGMVDELLEHDIPEYRERFDIRADDRYGISFPIQRTAQLLADRGETEQALDLVVDHVRRHDQFDAPYTAYTLPGQFFELAKENNRAGEFAELTQWILDGLEKAIDARLDNHPSDEPQSSEVDGEVFFSLFADRSKDAYEWTAAFMRLKSRIEEGISSARGRTAD